VGSTPRGLFIFCRQHLLSISVGTDAAVIDLLMNVTLDESLFGSTLNRASVMLTHCMAPLDAV